MNYKTQVYPNLTKPNKAGIFPKYAMEEWGNKARYIQVDLGSRYKLSDLKDPNMDIYPFIYVTLTDDNYGVDPDLYPVGKNPSWQPAPGDQTATNWYLVQ